MNELLKEIISNLEAIVKYYKCRQSLNMEVNFYNEVNFYQEIIEQLKEKMEEK